MTWISRWSTIAKYDIFSTVCMTLFPMLGRLAAYQSVRVKIANWGGSRIIATSPPPRTLKCCNSTPPHHEMLQPPPAVCSRRKISFWHLQYKLLYFPALLCIALHCESFRFHSCQIGVEPGAASPCTWAMNQPLGHHTKQTYWSLFIMLFIFTLVNSLCF